MKLATIVMAYYRQPHMLRRQMENWQSYPAELRDQFRFVLIDDGSPEPAAPIVEEYGLGVEVYRILVDILWNVHGARNLGAKVADDGWMLMTDLDHVLLPESAQALVPLIPELSPASWYRLSRRRTRTNDAGELETFAIKPHVNSFFVTRDIYWKAGGYDEDYSGCLCGDAQFHRLLEEQATPAHVDVPFDVYGASLVPDATTPHVPRDQEQRDECQRRIKDKMRRGDMRPKNPIRFPWERVL